MGVFQIEVDKNGHVRALRHTVVVFELVELFCPVTDKHSINIMVIANQLHMNFIVNRKYRSPCSNNLKDQNNINMFFFSRESWRDIFSFTFSEKKENGSVKLNHKLTSLFLSYKRLLLI